MSDNTGWSANFEFQIYNDYFSSINIILYFYLLNMITLILPMQNYC